MGKKEVPKNIKAETTKCEKCFICLSSKKHTFCPVRKCVRGKVHFIECKSDEYCNYKMPFGNSHVCTCPIRKYIYNTYEE